MSSVIKYVLSKFEGNRGLDYNMKILHNIGLLPNPNEIHLTRLHSQYTPSRLAIVAWVVGFLFGFISFPMVAVHQYGDITAFSEPIVLSLVMSMILTKGGSILFQPERVEQLTNKMEKMIQKNRPETNDGLEILRKTQNWTNVTVIYFIEMHLGNFIFTFGRLPFILYSRTFYTRVWFPFDVHESPIYEMVILLMCLIMLTMSWLTAVDTFFVSLLFQTIGQFKMLQYNLKNIRHSAVKTVRERKAESLKVPSPSESKESEAIPTSNNRTFISKKSLNNKHNSHRMESYHLDLDDNKGITVECSIHGPSTSRTPETEHDKVTTKTSNKKNRKVEKTRKSNREVILEMEAGIVSSRDSVTDLKELIRIDREVAMEMERRLGVCVKHHQELCSFVSEFESFFANILVNQLICNVVPAVLCIIYFTKVEHITMNGITFIILLSAGISELFVYSLLSNQVTTESSNVREAVYDIDWFNASESFKRSMRIIMSRANQPIVIMIAGYIPLSMETFHSVMKLTYSYYTTLMTAIDE